MIQCGEVLDLLCFSKLSQSLQNSNKALSPLENCVFNSTVYIVLKTAIILDYKWKGGVRFFRSSQSTNVGVTAFCAPFPVENMVSRAFHIWRCGDVHPAANYATLCM